MIYYFFYIIEIFVWPDCIFYETGFYRRRENMLQTKFMCNQHMYAVNWI